jgi:hypothetical protein
MISIKSSLKRSASRTNHIQLDSLADSTTREKLSPWRLWFAGYLKSLVAKPHAVEAIFEVRASAVNTNA